MKRFYSHYSFIYPDIYLKNQVVEIDDNRRIINIFPYEKEIEKTQFYSGLLVFLPDGVEPTGSFFKVENNNFSSTINTSNPSSQTTYQVYHEDIGKIML
ncbi:hypothetical protein GGR21_001797 [Dysgonomonas hofstadii]|uniref:Uncharacterized protein n=1 Tax=Dysgonomonas hofstadii TaxID=637886 RepID=A0A840CTR3_9BACT|nr:hypothetical protein [Dysgonomonas hofstadii]MBB4035902.1 hypothetical protein [Dysgonomonas hofstadii]